MFKNIVSFTLAMMLLFSIQLPSTAASNPAVTSWKDWTVTFSQDVNQDSNLDAIYIQSADQKEHPASVSISADSNKIVVDPKKPYLFGENYTLVIPKDVRSAKGKTLHKDVTKKFTVESDYIDAIETNYTALVTNVIVKQSSLDVAKVEMLVQGTTNTQPLLRGNDQFSKGVFGLSRGQILEIYVYDDAGKELETLYYQVK